MSGLVQHLMLARHERFAQHYLRTMDAVASYHAAGYKGNTETSHSNAYKLLKTRRIQALVKAAKEAAARKLAITAETVLRDLETLKLAAATNKRYAAAVRCCELQAKYLNLFPNQDRAPIDDLPANAETVEPVELQVRKLLFAVQVAIRGKANGHAQPAPPATKH